MGSLLDMGVDEFTDLVLKGRGSAILALRRQSSETFRATIETACSRHYSISTTKNWAMTTTNHRTMKTSRLALSLFMI